MAANQPYRILTKSKRPMAMYDKSTGLWSGYCIDLIKELQSILNFTYEIREPYDKEYGHLNTTTMEWNGIIRELVDGTADMAVAPFWMTRIRQTAVDFTEPYYEMTGISAVMIYNRKLVPFFRFLSILQLNVWLSFFGAFLLITILLYFFERFSPYSYRNNTDKYMNEMDDRFCHLKECFWFTLRTLLMSGGGEMPKNLSGKLCVVTWWLFGFIIVAAYTANFGAYQTLVRMEKHVQTLNDLTRQHNIEYSTVYDSPAHRYFVAMANVEEILAEKWESMALDKYTSSWDRLKLNVWEYPFDEVNKAMLSAMNTTGFSRTIEEAVARIRGINQTRPFALVADSLTIRYLILTTCDLIPVGEPIAKKTFAIAVPHGSPLKSRFNFVIRKLYAERKIDALMKKWWDDNPERIICEYTAAMNDGIGMDYMAAVFSLILLGIALSILIICLEYWWYYYVPRAVLKNSRRVITITNVIAGEIDSARS